jgi:hypothetical protein
VRRGGIDAEFSGGSAVTLLSRAFLRSPRSFLPTDAEPITLTRDGEIWARVQTAEPEPIQTSGMEIFDLDEIGRSFATRQRIRTAIGLRHVLVALQSDGVSVAWIVPRGCSAEALREKQRIQQLRDAHQNGACESLDMLDKVTLSGLELDDAFDRLLWNGSAVTGIPSEMLQGRPSYYDPNTSTMLAFAGMLERANRSRMGGGSS